MSSYKERAIPVIRAVIPVLFAAGVKVVWEEMSLRIRLGPEAGVQGWDRLAIAMDQGPSHGLAMTILRRYHCYAMAR